MKQLQTFSPAVPQNSIPKRYAILVLFQLQCFNDIEMQGFQEQVICQTDWKNKINLFMSSSSGLKSKNFKLMHEEKNVPS